MEIIRLDGEDQRLYYLVAHLVMNEEVLKYNLNYPYRTSSGHCWFIAVDEGSTLGFIPVELKEGKAIINNYYVADDDSKVFSMLLQEIVLTLQFDFEMESVTQLRHISDFEQNGFSIVYYWKRYVKMKVFGNGKERL
ncbi:MAG: hypothetical protein LBJ72_02550 [Dysgonamonadaceae bacterium]|jgi:hypothetical protein|nr:hypothetical protein [Dysgonamonadaceae bacterium]